jgi:hypothetical protein
VVTESDPEVAATVRLLHRRRGWAWTTVISVVAWLTACGLLGSLAPNASGAGLAVAAIFILTSRSRCASHCGTGGSALARRWLRHRQLGRRWRA